MIVLVRKPTKGHNNLFEWSPNGRNWYPINYKWIIPIGNGNPDPAKALEYFREAMNQMRTYPGFWIETFKGSYDRRQKVLRVKKNA